MTNHHTTPINARDLSSKLNALSPLETQTNDTDNNNMSDGSRRPRTSSLSSFQMPQFSKSSTMSSTESSSSDYSQLRVTHAVPKTKTNRESVEVGVGEFSKPRVNKRSRRDSVKSSRSAGANEDFRYYGRHGNQWLFNDFSVTDSVKKGWGRVFGRDDGVERDWYEDRK
ncbi:hypothetical protein CC86DRAFT_365754 [Ophiobolus disseminans]|uniref:Uncharacterized protein n=1 Tax=Ophiobolus disseminans TaxID=1469910 RepID=A0A6A7ANM5_9PLEO|nr:hypothetical protein CC86DRAFT_365754 [Ophiobolus disseminans]